MAKECNAVGCNIMQCNAMQYNAMQYSAMQWGAMQCSECSEMQCSVMAMLCSARNSFVWVMYILRQCSKHSFYLRMWTIKAAISGKFQVKRFHVPKKSTLYENAT